MGENNIINGGIVQCDIKYGDIDTNQKKIFGELANLHNKGADLAVLPEMWSCGFHNSKLMEHGKKTPLLLEKISETARKYKMTISGTLPEISGDSIYNTHYLVDRDGEIKEAYRKVHLFSPTGEDNYYKGGTKIDICETSLGKIGVMTCYDLRFPEICRTLALKGAEIVIVSAQWPITRIHHWDILLQARAIENQLFIIAANRCGKDKNLVYGGHSQIVSPKGDINLKFSDQECSDIAKIDLCDIETFRNQMDCLNERVPKSYDI